MPSKKFSKKKDPVLSSREDRREFFEAVLNSDSLS
jgi:hypothetical protein